MLIEPFTNVVFRDVSIEYAGGGTREQARISIKGPGVDARPLPAWGFYARNVKNLALEDVRLTCLTNDLRPALIGDGIERLILEDFTYPTQPGAAEALMLTNVSHVIRNPSLRKHEP